MKTKWNLRSVKPFCVIGLTKNILAGVLEDSRDDIAVEGPDNGEIDPPSLQSGEVCFLNTLHPSHGLTFSDRTISFRQENLDNCYAVGHNGHQPNIDNETAGMDEDRLVDGSHVRPDSV